MKFITRREQNTRLVGYSMLLLPEAAPEKTSDSFFDGTPIGSKSLPLHWIEENTVHRAPFIGDDIDNNRYFLGPQSIVVRDEVRSITHVLIPEPQRLSLIAWKSGVIESKKVILELPTVRAHVILDKFTGNPSVLSVNVADGTNRLFYNGKEIATLSEQVDFPFAAFSQVPVSMIATEPSPFGLISYKLRKNNQICLRRIVNSVLQEEVPLELEVRPVGGADFAIYKDNILLRVNGVVDGNIQHFLFSSSDQGKTFSKGVKALDDDFPLKNVFPSNAPVTVDRVGQFHVPILAKSDGFQHLIDLKPGIEATEAIVAPDKGPAYGTLSVFPSNPGPTALDPVLAGKGDGIKDGAGIIASMLSGADLLAANSQTGGYNYPHAALLNHDMPGLYAFKPSDCYTRGAAPNTVSMDYVYLEGNDLGLPIWNKLFIETWDMPLPEPELSARSESKVVFVEIHKSGFFYTGKTTFSFDDPTIEIAEVHLDGDRKARIICHGNIPKGSTISFETKNALFYHAGSSLIR